MTTASVQTSHKQRPVGRPRSHIPEWICCSLTRNFFMIVGFSSIFSDSIDHSLRMIEQKCAIVYCAGFVLTFELELLIKACTNDLIKK